jgi:hypothetical protein
MLKPLDAAPTDLGKKGEVTKHSGALDRMTGDSGDLRIYSNTDGSKTYVRLWEGAADAGQVRWYEAVPTEDAPATKKK